MDFAKFAGQGDLLIQRFKGSLPDSWRQDTEHDRERKCKFATSSHLTSMNPSRTCYGGKVYVAVLPTV